MGNKSSKKLKNASNPTEEEKQLSPVLIPRKYTFHSLPLGSFFNNDNFKASPSFLHTLDIPNTRNALIENFFTPEECKFLVQESENLSYQSLKQEYPEEYRNNERVLVKNEAYENVQPFGFANEGIWLPCAVNPVVKFNRYKADKKFLPHIDNMVALSKDVKSIFTIIVYLNDDFEGGETTFFQRPEDGKLPFLQQEGEGGSNALKKVYTVKPRQGSCLIFNHDVIHSGEVVTNGIKYIIRGEILFHRTTESASILANATSTTKVEASSIYSTADKLEEQGEVNKATAEYLRALQLQSNYSRSIRKTYPSSHVEALPDELLLMVLSCCNYTELVTLSRVNRRWHYYCGESKLWKQLYNSLLKRVEKLPPQKPAAEVHAGDLADHVIMETEPEQVVKFLAPHTDEGSEAAKHPQLNNIIPANYYYLFKNAALLKKRQNTMILITGEYYTYFKQHQYDGLQFQSRAQPSSIQITPEHYLYKNMIPSCIVHEGHAHYYDSESIWIGHDAINHLGESHLYYLNHTLYARYFFYKMLEMMNIGTHSGLSYLFSSTILGSTPKALKNCVNIPKYKLVFYGSGFAGNVLNKQEAESPTSMFQNQVTEAPRHQTGVILICSTSCVHVLVCFDGEIKFRYVETAFRRIVQRPLPDNKSTRSPIARRNFVLETLRFSMDYETDAKDPEMQQKTVLVKEFPSPNNIFSPVSLMKAVEPYFNKTEREKAALYTFSQRKKLELQPKETSIPHTLQEMVLSQIQQAPAQYHAALCANIRVAGLVSYVTNFTERLDKELNAALKQYPALSNVERIKVIAEPDRMMYAERGAKFLLSLYSVQELKQLFTEEEEDPY